MPFIKQLLSFLLTYILVTLGSQSFGQKTINLVPIGNLADGQASYQLFEGLKSTTKELKKKNTWLIGLGDYTDENGFSGYPGSANIEKLQYLEILSSQVHGSIFTSGDRDWDNSGKKGLEKIKDLQKYIQKELDIKKSFHPSDGCPGPEVVKLNSRVIAVIVNSQWFLHPFEKPEFPNTDCKISSPLEFWEELEDVFDDNADKRIILVAHHPVNSTGKAAGKKLGANHLIPIAGSFYNSFRKNIGFNSDYANPLYKQFRYRMKELMADHNNILYLSGHENNTEISKVGNNIHLNTGGIYKNSGAAGSDNHLFVAKENAYVIVSIDEGKDLEIAIYKQESSPEIVSIPWIEEMNKSLNESTIPLFPQIPSRAVAGNEYKASGFHKFWMGEHYRKEWTTPVTIPNLDLNNTYGGLVPYAKGGGLQTNSLKFKAPDGSKYSFRSVNKNPERALTDLAQQTIYKHLVKDLITTQHPYGGLVAASLLDHTDILHVNPVLYYLPPQKALELYNEDFGGSMGTLELRPSTSGESPFGGADKIVSSHQMFHQFYEHDNHKADKTSYARARAFDMWMGDWDRHEDNWKWAVYEAKDKTIYRPIPRDRDHVFSQWEGIIPSIADIAIPNAEHFDYEYHNLKHLNWKARHLDRQLGNELTLQDWLEAGIYLQSSIDTSDIRDAIAELPDEVEKISGEEIYNKLKNRLLTIDKALRGNYKLLATEVDVHGSNKKEEFYIIGNPDGSIQIKLEDNSILIFDRIFYPKETKIINLYGLEGKDKFNINIQTSSPIKVRIISGKGEDIIIDKYPTVKKKVNVYDKFEKDNIDNPSGIKIVKHLKDPEYNNKRFEYPAILPLPGIKNSSGNGLGIQLALNVTKTGFNKPGFSQKLNFEAIFYPGIDAHYVALKHRYRNMWRDLDGTTSILFSSFFSKYPFFYGLGNESTRDHELAEDEFYRIDYNTLKFNYSLSKTFWRKSSFTPSFVYEYNNIKAVDDEETFFTSTPEYNDVGRQHLYGIGADLDVNFKDNDLFTTYGSQLLASCHTYYGSESNFTKISGQIAQYHSFNILSNTTFILKAGGSTVIGDAPFYLQSTLGSNSFLRGHVRNRFVDRSAIYYNTEIRMHLGTWRTIIAPLKFGIFGLHDSGKVFDGKLNFSGVFHSTYGAGAYMAPIDESYSFTFTVANSEDKQLYFRMEFGWRL